MINVELNCDCCDRVERDTITDDDFDALAGIIDAAGWRWVEIDPEDPAGIDPARAGELLHPDCYAKADEDA